MEIPARRKSFIYYKTVLAIRRDCGEKAKTALKLEQVGSNWRDGRSQHARGLACRVVGQGSKPHFGASKDPQGEEWHYCFVGQWLWQQSGGD